MQAPADLDIRVDRRARRISLRLDAHGRAILTLPDPRLRAEGLRFAAGKREWLARQRARQPSRVPFIDGAQVPVAGCLHRICHDPSARDPVTCAAPDLLRVGGLEATAIPGLVEAWLRAEARRGLTAAVARYAAALGLAAPTLSLRDPKTRWGSCSSQGRLSFSWRLAMAPRPVLDYVAAHEVAHLRELNHSPRFWAICADLMPDYATHDAWLRQHGRTLHRYG